MRNKSILFIFLIVMTASVPLVAQSVKGMTFNGATGLITIPSARIGWEKSSDFGVDLGYHAIMDDPDTTHISKVSLSMFNIVEAAAAYDSQADSDNSDMLFNAKVQLPLKSSSAVAIGMNYQSLKQYDQDETATQIYISTTYPGVFFKMPAETTVVVGKTFGDIAADENIDFGMGFDLLLFPDTFKNIIHWINDFSNFSYSLQAIGADAGYRGAFNTGIRIDMASIPSLSKFKFVIDAIVTDALDENRAFALGGTFGMPIK
ncbi:MAG: hypothetical protein RBT69_02040 [Spirochaetia bacterium]|jgi:hypothetical protein|nr:hypothetical protein [Spirochaetia bacterium]